MIAIRTFTNEENQEIEDIFSRGESSIQTRQDASLMMNKLSGILNTHYQKTIESFSTNKDFLTAVQDFELEPIRAANVIRIKYEKVQPRSEDYLEATKANLYLLKEHFSKFLERQPFPLNPHPEDFSECPITPHDLIAINQEKTTLNKAGVSPDEDLSGCVLVAPDNVAGNKEYRHAVQSLH